MTYPRIGIYASLGNTDPVLSRPENIAKLARWNDVILDLGPAIEQPRIIAALRAANPAIRLHAYVVMKAYDWPGVFFQEMYHTVVSLNGFLRKVDGSMFEPNVNLAQPLVMDAIARVIAKYLPGTDALFLDVCPPKMMNVAASGIDFIGAGFSTEQKFADAWQVGHAALVQAIRYYTQRPDLVIENNPPFSHADVNGQVREAFPTLHNGPGDDPWTANMVTNHWGQPGLLREVYREPRASWLCSAPTMDSTGYNPKHPENLRRHRYGLASACLGGAFHSFGRYEGDAQWCADRLNFWYPEYSHPQRGKGWLGEARGSACEVINRDLSVGPLLERLFDNGAVVVNPTSKAHSVYFEPDLYRPINGVAKTAWSIPPHDALIMEAV